MSTNVNRPASPLSERRTLLLIGGAIAAVVLMALILVFRGPSPDQIVRNYLEDIADNRSSDAERWIAGSTYGDVAKDSQRTKELGPQMDLGHFNIRDLPGLSFRVGEVSITGESAEVTVNARAGGQSIAVPVRLVWNERGWRIDWTATNREVRARQEQINAASTGAAAAAQAPAGS